MNITFIGTGYVGLVSGVMMSHLGHNVTCLDMDENKIKTLQQGRPTIYEDDLEKHLTEGIKSGRLKFTSFYDENLADTDAIFVTVGTPPLPDGSADLSCVFSCIENMAEHIKPTCVIILKSTVPPGTCQKVQDFINKLGFNNKVASNPEFLREGSAIYDFLNTDRIVIGGNDQSVFQVMQNIYKPLTERGIKLLETDLTTSELIKYASNTFLANKIAFINELSDLCEVIGGNIADLSKGMGLDTRIGASFLKPGPGFGGSCFPKDILALQNLAQNAKSDFLVLDAIIQSNNNRPKCLVDKIANIMGGDIKGKTITIFGLTYKANTDDLRSSPAIKLIEALEKKSAKIVAYDPQGMGNSTKYFDDLECAENALLATKDSDAIIIATEWEEFKSLDFGQIKNNMRTACIFDLRNILKQQSLEELGFSYHAIGSKNMMIKDD